MSASRHRDRPSLGEARPFEAVDLELWSDDDDAPLEDHPQGCPPLRQCRIIGTADARLLHPTLLDVRAVQDWEQGRRVPDRAARVLLTVIDRDPESVVRALTVSLSESLPEQP